MQPDITEIRCSKSPENRIEIKDIINPTKKELFDQFMFLHERVTDNCKIFVERIGQLSYWFYPENITALFKVRPVVVHRAKLDVSESIPYETKMFGEYMIEIKVRELYADVEVPKTDAEILEIIDYDNLELLAKMYDKIFKCDKHSFLEDLCDHIDRWDTNGVTEDYNETERLASYGNIDIAELRGLYGRINNYHSVLISKITNDENIPEHKRYHIKLRADEFSKNVVFWTLQSLNGFSRKDYYATKNTFESELEKDLESLKKHFNFELPFADTRDLDNAFGLDPISSNNDPMEFYKSQISDSSDILTTFLENLDGANALLEDKIRNVTELKTANEQFKQFKKAQSIIGRGLHYFGF